MKLTTTDILITLTPDSLEEKALLLELFGPFTECILEENSYKPTKQSKFYGKQIRSHKDNTLTIVPQNIGFTS